MKDIQLLKEQLLNEGFTVKQFDYALKEIEAGTDSLTIELLLFRLHGLDSKEAILLIEQIREFTNILPRYPTRFYDQVQKNLLEGGYTPEEAKSKTAEIKQDFQMEVSNMSSKNILIGSFFLIIGLAVTFKENSNIIAYGAIIGGLSRFMIGISLSDESKG
jgi:hypothetical protein